MNTIRNKLVGMVCLLVLCGCSTLAVQTDYDQTISFSRYRTYNWAPGTEAEQREQLLQEDPFLDERFRRAVERELQARGFSKQESGTPDFLVSYHASSTTKTGYIELADYRGLGHYRYRAFYMPYEYNEQTLVLDILDAVSGKVIWRGSATDELSPSSTPQAKEKEIHRAVRRMLARFPPQ
ncbi:MAG: DUF4136 domain-containing protein [Deltaproteobacteria bacterium]|nr:DUF4136 domain-containing protein [Deltaproteobacteria bacterium]